MNRNIVKPGNFYAVGVGPGSPDLLTLRAADLIRQADVVVAPRSRIADESLALKAVQDLIRPDQEVIDHVYAMKRDIEHTRQNWNEIAKVIADRCHAGHSVVQITIGDPMIYSTSAYLMDELKREAPDVPVHIVPGISAFQSVASQFNQILTIQEDRMMLMPATDMDRVERALKECETLILYKAGKMLPKLAELLSAENLTDCAKVAFYVEQEGRECLFDSIDEAVAATPGYMATVILHINREEWKTVE